MMAKARNLIPTPVPLLALLATLAMADCQIFGRRSANLFPSGGIAGESSGEGGGRKGRTFLGPLSRVWKSGFFKHCEIVEAEIRNNDYDIFDGRIPLPSGEKRGWAWYSRRRGQKDLLLLHANLFDHFDKPAGGEIIHKSFNKKALAILVHELAHDFWSNILGDRERSLFAIEGAEFLSEILLAKTKEERLNFLGRTGRKNPRQRDFRPYEELLTRLRNYPKEASWDSELYSSLADLAFLGRIRIPGQLRKFYYGVVSDQILAKARA